MHIIIGVLTAFAGLVWALNRLQNSGVDINSFNPFYWVRRRNWEKKLGTKGMHQLDQPMEAASLLIVAVATCDDDLTRDGKAEITELFCREFNIIESRATELISSSLFLLRESGNLSSEVSNILAPTKSQFNSDQKLSIYRMLDIASRLEGPASQDQMNFIQAVNKEFSEKVGQKGSW